MTLRQRITSLERRLARIPPKCVCGPIQLIDVGPGENPTPPALPPCPAHKHDGPIRWVEVVRPNPEQGDVP